MSIVEISRGTTPCITKRHKPKGGDFIPTDMLTRYNSPNQTGSHPRDLTMGINMGMVIIMMATCSINVPKNNNINIITARTA
jgi:hypothetical protein